MRIGIHGDSRLFDLLRAAAQFRAQEAGLQDSEAKQVGQTVHEAAGVFRRAGGNRQDSRLSLEILIFPDRMEFLMELSGPKFPADTLLPASSSGPSARSGEAPFMPRVMDSCSLDDDFPDGNRLRMVKRLTSGGPNR